MEVTPSHAKQAEGYGGVWRKLNGLLVAQAFGQFNDQAWKQVVMLLAMAGVVERGRRRSSKTAHRPDRAHASASALLAAGRRAGRPSEQAVGHRRA